MAIKSSLFFTFDNRRSDEFGIINVNVSSPSGLPYDEPFLANRTINEVKIRGRDKPYFQEITHDPIEFTLSFAFQDSWDTDKIREVARWLSVEYYKPLAFSDNLDRVFYAMPVSSSDLVHNGLSQGWLTINFRCDSPYAFSPVIESQVYDLSSNPTNGTTIQFLNSGDVNLLPEMWIYKVGNGDVTITNLNNGGSIFSFTGLDDGETVYIDNANEYIESDLVPTTYRYSNFNNSYLELVFGNNNLLVLGTCKLRFRYEYIYLQG